MATPDSDYSHLVDEIGSLVKELYAKHNQSMKGGSGMEIGNEEEFRNGVARFFNVGGCGESKPTVGGRHHKHHHHHTSGGKSSRRRHSGSKKSKSKHSGSLHGGKKTNPWMEFKKKILAKLSKEERDEVNKQFTVLSKLLGKLWKEHNKDVDAALKSFDAAKFMKKFREQAKA